jgi:amino acid adenylation domain-containing protein
MQELVQIASAATESVPIDHGGPVDRPFEPFPCSALEGSLVESFNAAVRRFWVRVAVCDCTRSVTYGDLAILVDRIAAATAAAVADCPGPIAILLPRDVHFPAAMLAVLETGRGFVPLDASNPIERNRLIATQSGAAAVISAGDLASLVRALFPPDLPVVDIDAIGDAVIPKPAARPAPDDLAFIVYTSGSTGHPKGVSHSHRYLLHGVLLQTNALHVNAEDRVALVYSLAVIAGIREMMVALLNGAALHILPPNALQAEGLVREIEARGITIFRVVPVLLRRIAEVLGPDRRLDSVRIVTLASERVDWSDYDLFRRHFSPKAFLLLLFGSTECGIFAHWFADTRLRAAGGRLPVGRVLPDVRLTIEADDGRPVGDGDEVGEFVLASRYVALGYWREPDLTARAFAVDPADPKTRIFKTGDMGRMRPDGLLEFIGRRDQQFKLRGHRIEIGEIEAALGGCPGVEDAAVVVRRDDAGLPRSLAAYVEPSPGVQGLLPRDLLSMLMQRLPRYMVPATLRVVDGLPRLPNLKVDRVQLAQIDAARAAQMVNPTDDPLIAEVAGIFETVLGTTGATPDDNVSSLGGDSLQAVKVAIELETRFRIAIPADIFESTQTIGELARWIATRQAPRQIDARATRVVTNKSVA